MTRPRTQPSQAHPGRRAIRAALVTATAVAIAVVSACSGGGGARVPAPSPLPPPVSPPPASAFAYAPGTLHITLESRSIVRVAPDRGTARRGDVSGVTAGSAPGIVPPGPGSDTVVTTLHATFQMPGGARLHAVTGTVDSVTVRSLSGRTAGSMRPDSAPRGLTTAPLALAGTIDGGTVRIPVPPEVAASCSSPAGGYLAQAANLLPSLPGSLAAGTAWTDTTIGTSCRGGVVLTTTAIDSYHVTDDGSATGSGVATVARTTRYQLSGSGEQAGLVVSVSGEGSGTGELLVDVAAGRLAGARGNSTLRLTFEGAGRKQEVVQETEQRLTVIPDLAPPTGAGATDDRSRQRS